MSARPTRRWLWPRGGQPQYRLLDEEQFLAALEAWDEPDEALAALSTASFVDEAATDDWSDADWEALRDDLESFQLSDNGGES